jgi:hypothetical protein
MNTHKFCKQKRENFDNLLKEIHEKFDFMVQRLPSIQIKQKGFLTNL